MPAFTLWQREPSSIPVVIAVPHAGRSYPPELLTRMRHPGFSAARLEDRLVDLVATKRRGAAAQRCWWHTPRAP